MVPHGLLSESVEEEREEELEELSVAHASTLREMLAYQEDKHEEHMELIREHYEDQVRKVEQSYRMALDEEAQRIARELVNSHLRPQIAAEERKYTLDAIATATEQRNLELNEIKQTVMQGLKTVEANEAELQTVSSTMELSVGILELSEALRNQKPELVAESVKSLRTVAEKVNAHAIVDAALDALPQTVYEEPLTPVTDLMRRFPKLAKSARRAELGAASSVPMSFLAAAWENVEKQWKGESSVNQICAQAKERLDNGDLEGALAAASALAEHEVEDVRVVSKDWVADTRTFIQVARSLQILNDPSKENLEQLVYKISTAEY